MATTLESLREQIRSNLEAGNLEEAAAACLLGLHQYPRWVEGHRFLGEINLSQDALEEARSCFELVAAAEPDNATPYVGIGVVHEHLQRFPEAVVAFERALDLDQTDVEVRQELTRLYNELHLSRTVQTTRAGLAHQHLKNHMFRQAQGELDSLLSIEPNRLDLMVARARTAWIGGRLDIAEQTAREVISVSPDCVIANLIVGEVLARAGKTDLAAPFLTLVRELDPEAELSSAALRDVVSEGVVIAQGIPTSTLTVDIDVPSPDVSEAASLAVFPVDGVTDSPLAPLYPPLGHDAPATQTDWKPTLSTADQPKKVMTVQPGALESLLKDLDQVWPERLDMSDQASSSPVTSPVKDATLTTDLSPVDDEDLPPSFLGDVSEIIREFEDTNDHYDLFADLPDATSPSLAAQSVSSASRAESTPLSDPWTQTTPTKKWTSADDITISGQHAIIDLSAALDTSSGSTLAFIEAEQAKGHEAPPSSKPSGVDSRIEPRVQPVRLASNVEDIQPPETAPSENTGSELGSVIGFDTSVGAADTHAPWALPIDVRHIDFPPSPTEHDLAALLTDSANSINTKELASELRFDSPSLNLLVGSQDAHVDVDEAPVGKELAPSPSSSFPTPDRRSTTKVSHIDATSDPLTNATAKFEADTPDEALHLLCTLVQTSPETAESALKLLDEQSGGSRALRLRVAADCLMASARYWDAMAKYTEALDIVRAHSR